MWSNVQAGTYSVKAVVTDTTGATATSAPASVTVSSSGTVGRRPLPTPTGDPTTWPLVQASNLVYQGAFRLPGGSDDGNFVFGGQALAYNPANNSLFVEAAAINPQVVGEVTIPGDARQQRDVEQPDDGHAAANAQRIPPKVT